MMDTHAVARALGGEVAGPGKILAPGPGHNPHDRSMSVTLDGPDGFAVHSFAGDDWQDCRDHVRTLLGIERKGTHSIRTPALKKEVHKLDTVAEEKSDASSSCRRDFALSLWRETRPIGGTLADRYLSSRGLRYDGDAIRFHGSLRLDNRTVAGMIALMRDAVTNEPCGVHRTFLDCEGHKIGRKMLGRARGACVKLSGNDEVTLGLHIAEGIETALACMAMGFRPIWACLSAGGIAHFPVLDGIEALTIFADHDASGTGDRAARQCAARWSEAGCEARIISPPVVGDFADEIDEVAA